MNLYGTVLKFNIYTLNILTDDTIIPIVRFPVRKLTSNKFVLFNLRKSKTNQEVPYLSNRLTRKKTKSLNIDYRTRLVIIKLIS